MVDTAAGPPFFAVSDHKNGATGTVLGEADSDQSEDESDTYSMDGENPMVTSNDLASGTSEPQEVTEDAEGDDQAALMHTDLGDAAVGDDSDSDDESEDEGGGGSPLADVVNAGAAAFEPMTSLGDDEDSDAATSSTTSNMASAAGKGNLGGPSADTEHRLHCQ